MEGLNLEQLQLVALFLEIIGITLTFLDVFKHDVLEQFILSYNKFIKWSGIYVFEYGTKDPEDSLSLIKGICQFVSGVIVFIYIDLGNGFLWIILEYFAAATLGLLIGALIHILIASVFGILSSVLEILGKGKIYSGFGILLSLCGITIEIIQVYVSSFKWVIWVILLFFIYLIWAISIFQKDKNNPWDKK